MGLFAVGNGMMHAYVPVKLAADGVAPWVAGAAITAMAAGGLGGCLMTGSLVRRVGHARVFATLSAGVILSILILALSPKPLLWVVSRGLYGAATTGVFIVAQSWLNDASDNQWRGRVIAIFYTTYVVAIGGGAYLLAFIDLHGPSGPLMSILFTALAILPVGLTRLSSPPPPEEVSIKVASVWRISPVGLVGLLAVGGLTMMVQGFTPIYAAANQYSQSDIATLMFLMQFGMIVVQMPLGALSDRIDRRYVLIAAAVLGVASGIVATGMDGAALIWLILVFGIWGGATETIYAVANAHANDRAEPQYYVSLSSTLLVAWSVSGIVLPGIATLLTQAVGPKAYMYVAMTVAALYGGFVAYRLTVRAAPIEELAEPYQPISAQAPLTPELAPHPDDPEA